MKFMILIFGSHFYTVWEKNYKIKLFSDFRLFENWYSTMVFVFTCSFYFEKERTKCNDQGEFLSDFCKNIL